MAKKRSYTTATYSLRSRDVRKAVQALNRPSNTAALYQALRDLIGHAELIEKEGE